MLQQTKPVKFKDIPDGSYFMLSDTSFVYQKAIEDGAKHNAVMANKTNIGICLHADTLVSLVQA